MRNDDAYCDTYDLPELDTDLDAAWDDLTDTQRRIATRRAMRSTA